jgi:hypothetical protein
MRTEIGVGMILCPAVKNLGERGGLPPPAGRFFFSTNTQHDIAFGGEVRDILRNNRPAFRRYSSGTLWRP